MNFQKNKGQRLVKVLKKIRDKPLNMEKLRDASNFVGKCRKMWEKNKR